MQGVRGARQSSGATNGTRLQGDGADGFVIRDVERTTVHRECGRIGKDAGGTEGQGAGVQVGRTREGIRTGKDEFARTRLGQAKGARTVGED